MPALRDFIKRLGPLEESICSRCCQIIRPHHDGSSLEAAQSEHHCGEFSLNTVKRGEFSQIQDHARP